MSTANELLKRAYELLLSSDYGYYDIAQLEVDICTSRDITKSAIDRLVLSHGFNDFGSFLRERLDANQLLVSSINNTAVHFQGLPNREYFEHWQRHRLLAERDSEYYLRSYPGYSSRRNTVLDGIYRAMLKKSDGFHSMPDIEDHLSTNNVAWHAPIPRKQPLLHEILKDTTGIRIEYGLVGRKLGPVHYYAEPVDVATLELWKRYRRLEEERLYRRLFGEERSFGHLLSRPPTEPAGYHPGSTASTNEAAAWSSYQSPPRVQGSRDTSPIVGSFSRASSSLSYGSGLAPLPLMTQRMRQPSSNVSVSPLRQVQPHGSLSTGAFNVRDAVNSVVQSNSICGSTPTTMSQFSIRCLKYLY